MRRLALCVVLGLTVVAVRRRSAAAQAERDLWHEALAPAGQVAPGQPDLR